MPLPPQAKARVQKHSFHIKHDYQLDDMLVSHDLKRIELQKRGGDLDKVMNRPDAVRQELIERFPDFTDAEIEDELFSKQAYYIRKDQRLIEIVAALGIEINARAQGIVNRRPIGTTYYVDGDAGNNGSAGTSTGTAWLDIDQFTENGRVAGDICIVRRATTIDNGTDLEFSSDGTKIAPISIKADNANEFSDDVDLSVTATATLTFGSKTVTFSADISGVLAAGDVIYAASDDADEFAYEVDTVVTTTATLFLPYKGAQAGSGKTMTNMQDNPVWNTAAGDFQWNINADHNWTVQGIYIRGTDTNGNVEIDTSQGTIFLDCVFEGNGAGDIGVFNTDDTFFGYLSKCRFYNHTTNLRASIGASSLKLIIKDSLFDGNSVSSSEGIGFGSQDEVYWTDCEFKNHGTADIAEFQQLGSVGYSLRNCILSSTTAILMSRNTILHAHTVGLEDDGGLSVTAVFNRGNSADSTAFMDSDTGTVRSGGGAISMKITPGSNIAATELARELLFEYPIYATTTSKKYEVFFRPTATTDWTADPTASELWIELEYWGHATNDFRRITKSTGVIDMNGSTTFTALDVTVAPARTGVAYLRGYYAKTKESGKANTFFMDPKPVVA